MLLYPIRGRRLTQKKGRAALLVSSVALLLFASSIPLPLSAQELLEDEDEELLLPAEGEASTSEQPIAVELAQGIDLLNDQITSQEELLKTAQTDREKQLIRNHIRSLQKERRSLESLLLKLIGPNIDIRQAAREHQADLRQERDYKTLEKDDRQTTP